MPAHKFDAAHAHRLDDPDRARFQDPAVLIRDLGVCPGMVCVDIGAGTGFCSQPLADAVGPTGHVYALDIHPEMVARLAARFSGAANVSVRRSEESRLPLADGTADLALLVNVFHELADPAAILAEVRRVLRPDGRLAVLDWAKVAKEGQPGPPVAHRVAAEDAAAAIAAAGFRASPVEEPAFPYHYLLVASRCP
ncbi:MAG: methyltransferase domain-containing protein [Armatimonadetes bacterium]|nr:methyltransferase domain-containing protein [Armatimonadota bacterium]